MTTKQIAEYVGKPEKTVRTWASKASAKTAASTAKLAASSPAKPADWDLEETIAIIETGLGANAAAMYRANAERSSAPVQAVAGSSLTQRDLELVATLVTSIMTKLESRVGSVEAKLEERAALLPAPGIKPRDHVSKLVREHAERTGQEFRYVWRDLYRDFGYRTNTNPTVCARNRGMAIIDYIEAEGQIELLESVAMSVFGVAS